MLHGSRYEPVADELALMRPMADAMPALVWIDGPEGRQQYVNRRWCEYTGQTAQEADAGDWASYLHPEDRDSVMRLFQQSLESGHPLEVRCRYRRRDGAYRWFLNRAVPSYDQEGRIHRWFGTATDIQELVEAQDRLQAALNELEDIRHLFDALMEHIPMGIIVADATTSGGMKELRIRRISRFARDLIGESDDAVRSYLGSRASSVWQVYEPDGFTPLPRGEVPLIRAAQTGEVVKARELSIPQADGARMPVLSSAAPVYDRAGRITGAVSAWQDVSERKRAEERLAEARRLESVAFLASGVAHTFNNLLTPMIGYANMLRGELPPEKARMAEIIVESGERAAQLVKHLLAYAGKGQFVTSLVDLTDAVLSVWDLLDASVPDRVRLSQNLEPGMPPIAADPDQIEQIIINLVRNAAEAIPEEREGHITVRTSLEDIAASRPVIDSLSQASLPPGQYACLEVRDDGSGIDQNDMPKLFDPFFTTKFTGRGLGLPAAAGIVRSHQGAIEVESTVGQGSAFRVYFPVRKAATGA